MNKTEKLSLIFKIFTLALSILIIISGICLAISAANMYLTGGDTPYTRQRVGEYLLRIIFPLIATVGMAVITGVMSLILPKDEAKGRLPLDEGKMLRRLYSRYTVTVNEDGRSLYISGKGEKALCATADGAKTIRKNRRTRIIALIITAVFTVAAAVSAAIFALDGGRYTLDDVNGSIIAVCIFVLPLAVLILCCIIGCSFLFRASYRSELEAVKETVKAAESTDTYEGGRCALRKFVDKLTSFTDKHDFVITTAVRAAVIGVAIAFIILGIFNGGALETFGKAVRLCQECVGIG